MKEYGIVSIDITISPTELENFASEETVNWSSSNYSMSHELKPQMTKMGKTMHRLTVTSDNGDKAEILGEQDDISGDIIFHPFKLQNFNNSFYRNSCSSSVAGTDDDPMSLLVQILAVAAGGKKGTFAYIDPTGPVLIKEGKRDLDVSVALIDKKGTAYSLHGMKEINGGGDMGISFSINTPINEWLEEHRDLQAQLLAQQYTLQEKMNIVGKYLIQKKVAEEIDADEFKDIFCQAGLIGFSDNTVLNIYKLLM